MWHVDSHAPFQTSTRAAELQEPQYNSESHGSEYICFLRVYDPVGRKRIDAITRADIQDCVIQLKKEGVENRTINTELSIIRAMPKFGIGRGLAINNVTK